MQYMNDYKCTSVASLTIYYSYVCMYMIMFIATHVLRTYVVIHNLRTCTHVCSYIFSCDNRFCVGCCQVCSSVNAEANS